MTTVWSFGAYKCMFLILRRTVPQEHAVLNCVTQQTNVLLSNKMSYSQHSKETAKLSLTLPQLDP